MTRTELLVRIFIGGPVAATAVFILLHVVFMAGVAFGVI